MPWDNGLVSAFNPRALAIVGVSTGGGGSSMRITGSLVLRALLQAGFKGHIYPVNPKAPEVMGLKAYPSIKDIPEPLDLVIVAVPAAHVPSVLEDCVAAGALNVHVLTSGFAETGEEEGRALERRVREIATRGGIRLVGPNCVGLLVPRSGITTMDDLPMRDGPVSFVSQSGGHARGIMSVAPTYNLGISKVISFGNGLLIDGVDYLEYLMDDPDTKVICMYLEGAKDGRKLIRVAARANRKKPVIIWKGGVTDSGARAAASHTGSLAGNQRVWDAFFAQTGVVKVGSIEEMAESAMSFLRLRPIGRGRAALLGAGGGNSVAAGDICALEGLELPALSRKTQDRMATVTSLVNQGVSNPLDVPWVQLDPEAFRKTLDVIATDPGIDVILLNQHMHLLSGLKPDERLKMIQYTCDFARSKGHIKQLVVVFSGLESFPGKDTMQSQFTEALFKADVPVYGSLQGAARALRRFVQRSEFLAKT